ncbi:unnamed protein product [Rhizoctonia solani]|uniref:Thioredoxin domain-containing protein n=1 Tax=Rhizoctonia solani TaxID=456999 RepID=A0A8H3HVZ3_9AGAM|nr:unnamed protein product [Rhizoctonia solani]
MSGEVIRVATKDKYDRLLAENRDKLVVVCFYDIDLVDHEDANSIADFFYDELADEYRDVVFIRITAQVIANIINPSEVEQFPTFKFIKEGLLENGQAPQIVRPRQEQLADAVAKYK